MPSHAIVDQIVSIEPFDSAGTDLLRTTLQMWLADLSGCRVNKTTITIDIAAGDTPAAILAKIQPAAVAKATSLGYSLAANANLIITFTRA